MTGSKVGRAAGGAGWCLDLSVPARAAPLFELALEALGGALVVDGPDPAGRVPLGVYLAESPCRPEVAALLATAAAAAEVEVPAFTLAPLPSVDWVAESQKALPAQRAGRFYIYGSHVTDRPPAASLPIKLDANVAFGTGRHATTQGCLLALQDLAKRCRVRRPLDLGCGSGILAIAIAKLWACPVLAADLDANAVRQSAVNARANGVAALVRAVSSDGYRGRAIARRAPYDLVVANILAAPLSDLATDLRRHLAPGGHAVLSGLLADQQQGVLARHRGQGLALVGRIVLDGWATLVLARRIKPRARDRR